jgi:hypothetical protein
MVGLVTKLAHFFAGGLTMGFGAASTLLASRELFSNWGSIGHLVAAAVGLGFGLSLLRNGWNKQSNK